MLRPWTILILIAVSQAEDPSRLIMRAMAAYDARDYSKSAQLYEEAIKAGAAVPVAAYNGACCYGLLGKPDQAFTLLAKAIDSGWRDVEHLKKDADLESLHGDPRWKPMVRRCQEAMDNFLRSLKQPQLREQLLKRAAEDQRIRTSPQPNILEWHRIDADNTAFMKTVIENHGWPGNSMVGSDGALAAWLLVQHADSDVAFQKKCLELLIQAVEKKEALPEHMAYLTDRVLVWEGKPQRYGTQFHMVNGELVPQPIEDEANVDARRKQVGLPSLAEYARQMREMQKP